MKIIPRITTFLMFLVLSIANSFAAMNGQFKGSIDGNAIDIPVSCDLSGQDAGLFSVISDNEINPLEDANKDGIAMNFGFYREIMFMAAIAVKGEIYDFSGKSTFNGSSYTFKNKGVLKNKKKDDYEVEFILTCNK